MDTKCDDILQVLHEVCQTYPDQTAVAEGEGDALTYRQLWQQARQVAAYIKRHSEGRDFVGLHLPKSAAYIVSMIGCWMSGKAFVPIGTDLPPARQRWIAAHADIMLCIDRENYREALSCRMTDAMAPCLPGRPAYIIYSSGTTGVPKGILVGHAGLCNLARCQRQAFGVDHHSRYLFFLSVNFDASISDILVTLTSGATLVIEPMSGEKLSAQLLEVIGRRGVTHTDIPPSLLKMLSPEHCPDCLQTIVIGGEPADIETVRRWSRSVNLINVYGPTEATVCSSLCRCDPQWEAPLLGEAINGTHYRVYADGRLDATDGELWISGIGLAIGYHKDEELTRKKFPVVDGVRYYRTSDHVRIRHDGRLEFVGRIDRQVKIHGQLVELEEIEHMLRSHRRVGKVAVVKRAVSAEPSLRDTEKGYTKDAIVAFIQPAGDGEAQADLERQLRQCCKHHLPKWMMPSFFEFVKSMPLTPSGKTDLQALLTVPLHHHKTVKTDDPCATKEEEAIAHVMSDILKLPAMGPDDDFFLCGGDSLDTIVLISKLQQMGVAVTSDELHQWPTPRQLAQIRVESTAMCIHSSLLEREWQYPRDAKRADKHTPDRLTPAKEATNIFLLTGATGFLGAHLLFELLRRGQCAKVICLVRGASPADGLQRVCGTFRRYGLDVGILKDIETVCGDITLPCLGIPADDYKRLSDEVTAVIHCAATVNMLANYETLKAANVTGTRNIIDFCLTGVRKKLHFASTLSVFVSTDRNRGTAYESDDLSIPTHIYGGYGQTKFVAEKMVQSIPPAFCDVFIYRYGLLCGDTLQGKSAPKDFLGMFFRGARTVGILPYDKTGTMAVDITPIDQASHIVADIIGRDQPGVYHIASENPLKYNDLCTILKEEGIIGDIVDDAAWKDAACSFTDNADVQALRMSLCRMDETLFRQMRYMDLFQTTGIRFDMTNTHAATALRCRQHKELIQRYIRQSYETI